MPAASLSHLLDANVNGDVKSSRCNRLWPVVSPHRVSIVDGMDYRKMWYGGGWCSTCVHRADLSREGGEYSSTFLRGIP